MRTAGPPARILAVVPRYGSEIVGGAEALCRELAVRMAARGAAVEVATTCATSYVDWADVLPPGPAEVDGVVVHRFPVRRPRVTEVFDGLNTRVLWASRFTRERAPRHLQEAWMRAQGPDVPALARFVAERSDSVDVVALFSYLYATTYDALHAARAPVLLHPLAHDEPPLRVPLFDLVLRAPDAYCFATPEERDLVARRVHLGGRPAPVVGIGTEPVTAADPAPFRARFGLGDRPYVVVVGRVDPSKGSTEVVRLFDAYKRRHPGPLALALVGDPAVPPPPAPDVVVCGAVDEATKASAVAGAACLVQPSYFESFSLVLSEAWALARPVLVNGRCDVLRGQVARAGGGLAYAGFEQFEAGLDLLLHDADLGRRLGRAGRAHTLAHQTWDAVLARYERLLRRVAAR